MKRTLWVVDIHQMLKVVVVVLEGVVGLPLLEFERVLLMHILNLLEEVHFLGRDLPLPLKSILNEGL